MVESGAAEDLHSLGLDFELPSVDELSTGLRPQRSASLVTLPSLGTSRECRTPASDAMKRARSGGSGERLCMHCHAGPPASWPPGALCLCKESSPPV